jgi:predicted dehydrogenase
MRLAVVGLGFMGKTHVKAIERLPEIELACVVKRDGSLEQMLADPSIDAVDLCLPTDLHEATAIAALRAGKHVLVEKPMALDGAACDRMIEEAHRQDRILMVAQVLRFMPPYTTLGWEIQREPVRTASFRRRCGKPAWAEWLADPKRSGGGVFDLLIHDVDMALHLFGQPDAISATGFLDSISARFFYRDGMIVEISGGWLHDGFPFAMEFTLQTDRMTLDYHSGSGKVIRSAAGLPPEEITLASADGYESEIAYFAECVRTGQPPARSRPEESAAAVRVTLGMLAAQARNGEKVAWKSE